ncbi:MAG: helix-turn-helix domain-containing protein [Clostridia bacterium]|nr:helix-turn-helix domain-containing protein [Clostridia bacterium]
MKDIDYFIVQCNIQSLLKLRNEKQSDLAAALGVRPRTVNRWVRGSNGKPVEIPTPQLKNIADHFGISTDTLTNAEKFTNEIILNADASSFGDLCALEDYLTAIGITVEYGDISRVVEVKVPTGEILKFGKPEDIYLTWTNEKGKTVTSNISYSSFETLARKLKALAMLEIQYIK